MRRKPYTECPLCHAHLDHGEHCDCENEKENEKKRRESMFTIGKDGRQMVLNFGKGGEISA